MQHQALHTLAGALVRAGQWEAAQRAGEAIADPALRGAVLKVLAESLSESKPGPHITEIAQNISSAVATIPELQLQTEILQLLASSLAVAGHNAEAVDYFTVAHQTIDAVSGEKSRAELLHNLAKALATTEQWAMAWQTVHDIAEASWRVRAWCELAQACVRAEQHADMALQTAYQTIGSVPNAMVRVKLVQALACTMGTADQWDDARHIVNEISNSRLRDEGLQKLVSEAIVQKQWTIARQIANDILEMQFRAAALMEIATARVSVGHATASDPDFQSARQAADSIPEARFRAAALRMLGQTLVDVDKEAAVEVFHMARQATGSINDPRQRAEALSMLAQVLGDSGQWQRVSECWDDARQTLAMIPDGNIRRKTQIMMVHTLARSGRYEEARQVADTISDIGGRVEALRAIAQAYGDAKRIQEVVALIQAVWVDATNHKELLMLVDLVCPLLIACPEMDIGNCMFEGISWADRQYEALFDRITLERRVPRMHRRC
jgi:tetratricopeptide (TPR) repeat protein